MTTVKDVAQLAETSIATVSRVLNNQEGFSEATRKRVMDACETLGYESNAIARSLKKMKTRTIGVVFPNISSMLTNEFLNGIEEIAHEKNYSVIVSYSYSDTERMLKSLKTFQEKRVDGIIFASEDLKDKYYNYIQKMKIPLVLLSTSSEEYDVPSVKVDDFKASYAAVEYLIQHGHSEIGLLAGNSSDTVTGIPRFEGYKQALEDNDLTFEPRKVAYGHDYSFEDGQNLLPILLKQYPEMTAMFAMSDSIAVGAISKAHQLNILIPSQLSIIGFDNIIISQMVTPSLTTVAQPLIQMGSTAAELLLKLIHKTQIDDKHLLLPFKIIERDSVSKR